MQLIRPIQVSDSIETLVEIDIRGRFLMMACDIELTLIYISLYCAPDPLNPRKFEGLMMHNKIDNAISDLKKHKPEYYEEYKDELEKLWHFKEVRNDLAHYKLMPQPNKDFKEFHFLVIQKNAEGKERLHYKPYTLEYLTECLNKFRLLNLTLAELVNKLDKDFKILYPEGFLPS
jgi:hypothetical protein